MSENREAILSPSFKLDPEDAAALQERYKIRIKEVKSLKADSRNTQNTPLEMKNKRDELELAPLAPVAEAVAQMEKFKDDPVDIKAIHDNLKAVHEIAGLDPYAVTIRIDVKDPKLHDKDVRYQLAKEQILKDKETIVDKLAIKYVEDVEKEYGKALAKVREVERLFGQNQEDLALKKQYEEALAEKEAVEQKVAHELELDDLSPDFSLSKSQRKDIQRQNKILNKAKRQQTQDELKANVMSAIHEGKYDIKGGVREAGVSVQKAIYETDIRGAVQAVGSEVKAAVNDAINPADDPDGSKRNQAYADRLEQQKARSELRAQKIKEYEERIQKIREETEKAKEQNPSPHVKYFQEELLKSVDLVMVLTTERTETFTDHSGNEQRLRYFWDGDMITVTRLDTNGEPIADSTRPLRGKKREIIQTTNYEAARELIRRDLEREGAIPEHKLDGTERGEIDVIYGKSRVEVPLHMLDTRFDEINTRLVDKFDESQKRVQAMPDVNPRMHRPDIEKRLREELVTYQSAIQELDHQIDDGIDDFRSAVMREKRGDTGELVKQLQERNRYIRILKQELNDRSMSDSSRREVLQQYADLLQTKNRLFHEIRVLDRQRIEQKKKDKRQSQAGAPVPPRPPRPPKKPPEFPGMPEVSDDEKIQWFVDALKKRCDIREATDEENQMLVTIAEATFRARTGNTPENLNNLEGRIMQFAEYIRRLREQQNRPQPSTRQRASDEYQEQYADRRNSGEMTPLQRESALETMTDHLGRVLGQFTQTRPKTQPEEPPVEPQPQPQPRHERPQQPRPERTDAGQGGRREPTPRRQPVDTVAERKARRLAELQRTRRSDTTRTRMRQPDAEVQPQVRITEKEAREVVEGLQIETGRDQAYYKEMYQQLATVINHLDVPYDKKEDVEELKKQVRRYEGFTDDGTRADFLIRLRADLWETIRLEDSTDRFYRDELDKMMNNDERRRALKTYKTRIGFTGEATEIDDRLLNGVVNAEAFIKEEGENDRTLEFLKEKVLLLAANATVVVNEKRQVDNTKWSNGFDAYGVALEQYENAKDTRQKKLALQQLQGIAQRLFVLSRSL